MTKKKTYKVGQEILCKGVVGVADGSDTLGVNFGGSTNGVVHVANVLRTLPTPLQIGDEVIERTRYDPFVGEIVAIGSDDICIKLTAECQSIKIGALITGSKRHYRKVNK